MAEPTEQIEYDNTLNTSTNDPIPPTKSNHKNFQSQVKRSFSESALVTSAKPVSRIVILTRLIYKWVLLLP